MPKESEFTQVIDNIVSEAATLRETAAKSKVPPPLEERLSNREARARVASLTPQDLLGMTPENREALLKAVGVAEVMNIIRRKARA